MSTFIPQNSQKEFFAKNERTPVFLQEFFHSVLLGAALLPAAPDTTEVYHHSTECQFLFYDFFENTPHLFQFFLTYFSFLSF